MRNTLLLLGSILVGLLLSELLLRIYNPIETRIRGERIILRTNTVYDMPNLVNPKLASRLVHTRNNIGFRGPDWPPAPDAITLFAVGGSTTEGFYLSDGNDWPAVTARYLSESHPIWMNNAGLDGHSTFGHTILLNDILHTYQPDYILYLIGANDVGRMDLNDHRQSGIASVQHALSSLNGMLTFMAHRSELAALVDNAIRGWRASRLGVTHLPVDFATLPEYDTQPEVLEHVLHIHETVFLPEYRTRLRHLVEQTRRHGITPVLITQPVPYGPAIDPGTGRDLSRIKVRNRSGYMSWREVERYNDITREVAEEMGALLIDLERALPKNTRFYYDTIHFSDEGAYEVGRIIAQQLLYASKP